MHYPRQVARERKRGEVRMGRRSSKAQFPFFCFAESLLRKEVSQKNIISIFPLKFYNWNWRTALYLNFSFFFFYKIKEIFFPRAVTQLTKWQTHILGNFKHKVNSSSYLLYQSCHWNLSLCEKGGTIKKHLLVGLTFQMLVMLP